MAWKRERVKVINGCKRVGLVFGKRIFNHRLDAVLLKYHNSLHLAVWIADGM